MIFIIDNGRSYSDHSISFYKLDVPEGFDLKTAGEAMLFIEAGPFFNSDKPFIVGMTPSIDWWRGDHFEVKANKIQYAIEAWHQDYVDSDDRMSYKQQYQAALELMKALDPQFDLIDFKYG